MPKTTRRITKLGMLVDQLGKVKAQIAKLEKQEEELKQQLSESGKTLVGGTLFKATISHQWYSHTDYKELLEALAPPKRLVNKFTELREKTVITVRSY